MPLPCGRRGPEPRRRRPAPGGPLGRVDSDVSTAAPWPERGSAAAAPLPPESSVEGGGGRGAVAAAPSVLATAEVIAQRPTLGLLGIGLHTCSRRPCSAPAAPRKAATTAVIGRAEEGEEPPRSGAVSAVAALDPEEEGGPGKRGRRGRPRSGGATATASAPGGRPREECLWPLLGPSPSKASSIAGPRPNSSAPPLEPALAGRPAVGPAAPVASSSITLTPPDVSQASASRVSSSTPARHEEKARRFDVPYYHTSSVSSLGSISRMEGRAQGPGAACARGLVRRDPLHPGYTDPGVCYARQPEVPIVSPWHREAWVKELSAARCVAALRELGVAAVAAKGGEQRRPKQPPRPRPRSAPSAIAGAGLRRGRHGLPATSPGGAASCAPTAAAAAAAAADPRCVSDGGHPRPRRRCKTRRGVAAATLRRAGPGGGRSSHVHSASAPERQVATWEGSLRGSLVAPS